MKPWAPFTRNPLYSTNPMEGYSPQMARLRSLGRTVGSLGSTLAVGALSGFIATAVITPMLPGPVQPGNRHEPVSTRQYMVALVNRDGATMNRLELPANAADHATRLKSLEGAFDLGGSTLTFLGGGTAGPIGAYVYILGTTNATTKALELRPVALALLEDKVLELHGGSTGNEAEASQAPSQ